MSDLDWYLDNSNADPALLRAQWSDAVERRLITCPCGRVRALELAFRCLYCGIYFCAGCAELHFGETRKERRDKNVLL